MIILDGLLLWLVWLRGLPRPHAAPAPAAA
jgi:hypothetical protein